MMRPTIFWIAASLPGRLAIMPRPRSGDWLEDEITAWRADGIDVVVCLLDNEEINELGLRGESELCHAAGIEFVSFPIRDRGVPSSVSDMLRLARTLRDHICRSRGVAIHCRAGIGRSSLMAASVLVLFGIDADKALGYIAQARGIAVPDTDEQRLWVFEFARATRQDVEEVPCTS